jgi:hypothetical protein
MREYLKEANVGGSGHQLEALGNALVRCMVFMAPVPTLVALLITPSGHQPYLGPVIDRTHYLHSEKTGRVIDEVGPEAKRGSDLIRFVIGNHYCPVKI